MKKILLICGAFALAACAGSNDNSAARNAGTPTVDYVETLDVNSAPAPDSFLNQLAMNYRSFAIYNARQMGDAGMGELFANKAVSAFSGETPFPESLGHWSIADENTGLALQQACNDLIDLLKRGASDTCPQVAAEAQAKYDCWLTATAIGNTGTAKECQARFNDAMAALRGNLNNGTGCGVARNGGKYTARKAMATGYYPDTRNLKSVTSMNRAREGVVIVNNINVPQNLINPVPVSPVVFNQNIYGADGAVITDGMMVAEETVTVGEELVSREEFINMMMALRSELAGINARLDKMEMATIKVQQIPLEPTQKIMEEIFEVGFDFDKSKIKPEYQDVIRKLAESARANKNVKVSVVGHTDTMGSDGYNYALGGRRAEAVRKMLIENGIPAGQIVTVSSGENDLKVPTANQVASAANRRVRVVKETPYMEEPKSGYMIEETIVK